MSDHMPLDYQPVTQRSRRKTGILGLVGWIMLGAVVLSFFAPPSRAPETARRAKCSYNLRQIAVAIEAYGRANKGQYPGDMGLLISDQGLSANVFLCPSTSDTALPGLPAQQAATLLVGKHCSYVYVGSRLTTTWGDEVVAFDLLDNHSNRGGPGGNVLYGDGHVSWEKFETLVQLVPELEAGRNPPNFVTLTAAQAQTLYTQKWLPKLASFKNGTWAASLPRPTTRPLAAAN